MKKFISILGATLGIAISAGASTAASQPKWVSIPRCSATTTNLTCSGKATGLDVRDPFLPPTPAIFGRVAYTCAQDPTVTGSTGTAEPLFEGGFVKNGRTFSVKFAPGPTPEVLDNPDGPGCPSGVWTRNPSYFNVSVAIAQTDASNFVLFSPLLGTISP
jgi:hypothetical protein